MLANLTGYWKLVSSNRYRNPAGVGRAAVFPQVDSLPGTEIAAIPRYRDGEPALREYAAYVCRHVVRALIPVFKHGITIRHQSAHESFQIGAHGGIGVFTQYQRGAGMMHEDVAEALFDSGCLHQLLYMPGNFMAATAPGVDGDGLLVHVRRLL